MLKDTDQSTRTPLKNGNGLIQVLGKEKQLRSTCVTAKRHQHHLKGNSYWTSLYVNKYK